MLSVPTYQWRSHEGKRKLKPPHGGLLKLYKLILYVSLKFYVHIMLKKIVINYNSLRPTRGASHNRKNKYKEKILFKNEFIFILYAYILYIVS